MKNQKKVKEISDLERIALRERANCPFQSVSYFGNGYMVKNCNLNKGEWIQYTTK